MANQFYIKSGDKTVGPLSTHQIVSSLKSGQLTLFDFILDHQSKEWIMLMQHPDFCEVVEDSSSDESLDLDYETQKPHVAIGLIEDEGSSIVQETTFTDLLSKDNKAFLEPTFWYEKSRHDYPLRFLDVLSLLHDKKINEETLLAQNPHGPWQKLSTWTEFSNDSIAKFKESSETEIPDVHIRRRHARYNSGSIFLIIANNKISQIYCSDISKSGMAFLSRNPRAQLNDVVMIKFSKTPEGNKVDAKGTIVSIRKAKIPNSNDTFIRYGVKFTHLTTSGQTYLDQLA